MTSRVAHYTRRLQSLESERSRIIDNWREASDYILGFRGRFLVSDRNKVKNVRKIVPNNTARMAARTLASGMMAGITSPARPWFQLGTLDPDLKEYGPVKYWLHDVQNKMRDVFAQSNLYNQLHGLYAELGTFGTAVLGVYYNFDNVIHTKGYTAGSYCLATDGADNVNVLYRKYQMSVFELVKEFGLDNVSEPVRRNWQRGNTESRVDVIHVIEPNDDADMQKPQTNFPYRSVYFEAEISRDRFLRVSGFEEFPIMAPRWDLTGDDTYGTNCPGFDAMGDIKSLQLSSRRKAQALDKLVDPPLQAPVSLKTSLAPGGFMPGDMAFVSDTSAGIKSIYDFRPDFVAIGNEIREDEYRIKRAFYEDLFLMLANSDRRQITAREIEEKHEEKLLMLGPVLERLHYELLNPLIKRTYETMLRAGVLPPAPDEINQTELNVEYISVLAQAQRLTAVNSLERLSAFAMNIAQVWPEARHKVNAMQSIDEYANAVGVSPHVINDDDTAEGMLQAEQQRAAAAQAAEMAQPLANSAKALGDTDVESATSLARAMGLA